MDKFTVNELKAMLQDKGLSCKGKKSLLITRLEQAGVQPAHCIEEVKPEDSVSQVSNRSYHSENSLLLEKRINEAADKAAILAKQTKLIELQKLEEQELLIKQRKERIKLEIELAELEARDKVFTEYEGSDGQSKVKQVPKISGNSGTNVVKVESELVRQLVSYNLRGLMPKVEVQTFRGDLTQYQSFIRSFDSLISDKLSDEEEKLYYLEQYTDGKPRDIVRACMNMDKGRGYREARTLLNKRYGNAEKIASGFIEKILHWPDVNEDDVESLDDFSIMLRCCKNAVSKISLQGGELENPKTMRKILSKVPFCMQERFRRKADDISASQNRRVKFDDLVEFVQDEARIATNPFFGKHLFENQKRAGGKGNNVLCNALKEVGPLKCWFCEGPHLLEECTQLQKKDHNERISFLIKKRLCFNCLRPGHLARFCRSAKKTCSTCRGSHPTVLHKDACTTTTAGQSDEICASIRDMNTFRMPVVPIKIKAANGRCVETYAFLDNGSSATFCSRNLLAQLGVMSDGVVPAQIDVLAIHGTTKISCWIVDNLTALDLDENTSIPLPPVYAIEKLPVSEDDVLIENELKRHPKLCHLEIPNVKADIGILIGINVPEALEPWEVIHSSEQGGRS